MIENYGVNVDIVLNELNFHKSMLEVDLNKTLPSTSATISSNENPNIAVGSIIPMSSLTVVPIDVMEIREQLLLDNLDHSWAPELDDLPQSKHIDTVDKNGATKTKMLDKLNQQQICGVDQFENETEWNIQDERDISNQNEISGKKESDKQKDTVKERENETEKDKEKETQKEKNSENDEEAKKEYDKKTETRNETASMGFHCPVLSSIENIMDERNKETKRNPEVEEYLTVKPHETDTTVILDDKNDISTNNDTDLNNHPNKFDDVEVEDKKENRSTNSDPFQKHLKFPEDSLKKKNGTKRKENLPSAISSAAWRNYYSQKDKEKKEKIEKANMKRKEREEKRATNNSKPRKLSKKRKTTASETDTKEKVNNEARKEIILCTLCEEELFSDAEDDGDKNIGCDECPRWYHLKCTDLSELNYDEAAQKDYVCDMCR